MAWHHLKQAGRILETALTVLLIVGLWAIAVWKIIEMLQPPVPPLHWGP